jgi:hypothetical protein
MLNTSRFITQALDCSGNAASACIGPRPRTATAKLLVLKPGTYALNIA